MHYIFWFLMPDRIQVGPGSIFTFSLKIQKPPTALQKSNQIRLEIYSWILISESYCQIHFQFKNAQDANCLTKNQIGSVQKHILAFSFVDPNARQEPGRAGYHTHFQFKNSQDSKCLIETRQDSGRNIFMNYIFWFIMPDRIQLGPGSRFTFSLKIHKTATALQKTKSDPG